MAEYWWCVKSSDGILSPFIARHTRQICQYAWEKMRAGLPHGERIVRARVEEVKRVAHD